MPIYEYQCSDCGHELEALQKMTDDALKHCPECHAQTLRKKISAAGFQLKGTGWYETDFKNSGSQTKPQSAGASEGKSSGTPASGTGVDKKPKSKGRSEAA